MTDTVLLTGATGFVGAAVARQLLAAGHDVRALVRATSDRRNLAGLELHPVVGDLRDPASLSTAVRGCSAVFHVAADYRLWTRNPGELYAVNVDGSRALIAAAARAGVTRVVYTSSVATLGVNADGAPADETTPVTLEDMIGDYKRSKFIAEQAVNEMAADTGIGVVTVNPSTPIGPRDIKPTPTGRIVVDAASGRIPAFVDTGLNVAHVDDVARGHLLAYEHGKPGQRYILGGEDMSLERILAVVCEAAGRPAPRIRLPHGVVMPIAWIAEGLARLGIGGEPMATVDGVRMARKKMYFSHAKADQALGYRARPAVEALHDALTWFLENGYVGGSRH